ncbi:MAG: BMP family ABC transporter substrate-binding protein [Mogibacterium sp.]|nr:BMP family ABC transporter substrate-binding protein [Mogibacterium sp.]
MMKKFLVLLLAALMVFSFAACGGGGGGSDEAADDGAMKVAMVTDYGDITDQSFNQTTYEACKAFCEENGIDFTYKKPASDSTADRVSSIEEAIEEGYGVIVMPGYAFADAIYEVAPLYPDTKFVALDVSEGDLTAYGEREFDGPNVFSAVYQEELAGYMAGYAAVKLGYTKLGFLGGMAVPAVQRYGHGFVQGADAAAGEAGVDGVEIKYVYGGQFFGDADITAAMDTWYSQGTECVFACGGGIYTSAAEAAAKVGGKVIGVDVDQAGIIDGAYGEGMTVTSAMKGLGATVNTLLSAIRDDNWDEYAGQIKNLGLVSETPADNYVQLPESTQWADGFQQADYEQLVKELFSGERTVSADTEKIPAVKNIKVDDQGAIKG